MDDRGRHRRNPAKHYFGTNSRDAARAAGLVSMAQDEVGVASAFEREELRAAVRNVAAAEIVRRAPIEHPGGAAGKKLWGLMAELGWLSLYLPEQQGGLGQPFSVLATLYTELGRALSPAPLLGSMLAVNALADVGEDGADNAL